MNASELNDLLVQLNFCNSDYTHADYDTFENSIKAIEQLRKERDEARREACKNAGVLRSVVDPDQDMQDWANYIARVKKWDCYEKETH